MFSERGHDVTFQSNFIDVSCVSINGLAPRRFNVALICAYRRRASLR